MAQFTAPQFVPPQPSMPQNSPSGRSGEGPSSINIPGSRENAGEVTKSVVKSHAIKTTTSFIINSREDLAKYLSQYGLDLVTSWVEFEQTKDFIISSYVVYPQHNNAIEKLTDFITRYPQLQEPVQALNQKIINQYR